MELKTLRESDWEVMAQLLTDTAVKQTYMLPDLARTEDALPLFRRLMALSEDASHFVRGIWEAGQLVGFCNDVEIHNGRIEMGYVIHPAHWGKGYGTNALKLAVDALFVKGFQEILAGAFSENRASIRVMEKAGMERIDQTEEIEYRGKIHQCIYYSIKRR